MNYVKKYGISLRRECPLCCDPDVFNTEVDAMIPIMMDLIPKNDRSYDEKVEIMAVDYVKEKYSVDTNINKIANIEPPTYKKLENYYNIQIDNGAIHFVPFEEPRFLKVEDPIPMMNQQEVEPLPANGAIDEVKQVAYGLPDWLEELW